MHIHILGICGTFMAGLALLARRLGHTVSGSDANVYPPMSTQLQEQGIELFEGYDPKHLKPAPDCVVIGNALSRGNPLVESVLNDGLYYTSGPQWLAQHVLNDRWVLAVAGTHGKTTTASMLSWILQANNLNPGFLIGGIPANFAVSAQLGEAPFFVIEADEYDTAFFDKRAKFVHYRPRTLVINNLEYDHADIYPDLAAIQRQFHHLVRTVPGNGLIIAPGKTPSIDEVLAMGCWSEVQTLGDRGQWQARLLQEDGGAFEVAHAGKTMGTVTWSLIGQHNVANALAAVAAARHAGVKPEHACEVLAQFKNVKRRLEVRDVINGVTVYDDFAHHPTAIRSTLEGLRSKVGGQRIIAVLEPRSNTMRMGVHAETLAPALQAADAVLLYQPQDLGWSLRTVVDQLGDKGRAYADVAQIIARLRQDARAGDHVLIMSNGGFENLHQRLCDALKGDTAEQRA